MDISIPEDHEDAQYAGKTASYTITVKQIKEENLPELNQELFCQGGWRKRFQRRGVPGFLEEAPGGGDGAPVGGYRSQ